MRGGAPLSTALERQHGTFSRLYVNMVRAGEAGGTLHETLQRLADYLERSARAARPRDQRADLSGDPAGRWSAGALLFLLGYVVPQFAAMYESLDVELPWFTKMVLGIGLFVRDWWIVLLVAAGAGAVVVRPQAARSGLPRGASTTGCCGAARRRRWSRKLETARLARTLGTLLRNGVPLLTALGIARNVLGNRVLAGAMSKPPPTT